MFVSNINNDTEVAVSHGGQRSERTHGVETAVCFVGPTCKPFFGL